MHYDFTHAFTVRVTEEYISFMRFLYSHWARAVTQILYRYTICSIPDIGCCSPLPQSWIIITSQLLVALDVDFHYLGCFSEPFPLSPSTFWDCRWPGIGSLLYSFGVIMLIAQVLRGSSRLLLFLFSIPTDTKEAQVKLIIIHFIFFFIENKNSAWWYDGLEFQWAPPDIDILPFMVMLSFSIRPQLLFFPIISRVPATGMAYSHELMKYNDSVFSENAQIGVGRSVR